MAGIGAWLGPLAPVSVVLPAAVTGCMALLTLQRLSAAAKDHVAFGPFLCLSAWAVWLYGSIEIVP